MISEIETVRRFNRTVTRAIGVLDADYQGRGRSLAASRLLYEIGGDAAEVRELRERLALDSGYLSRLLRELESEGLVELAPAPHDHRVRRAELTDEGFEEFDTLNRLSDAAAQVLLDRLAPGARRKLVEAMHTVERLLVAGSIEIEAVDVDDPRVHVVLRAYYDELGERFASGFDPHDEGYRGESDESAPRDDSFLLATIYGAPVGCGALHHHSDFAEIKRMWVDPAYRGIGTGYRILERLETEAHRSGYTIVRMDTNDALTAARSLYQRAGYREIPRYNDNPYADRWYEKRLAV